MNIIDIYNKYHLPENLQMHMLRVAPDGVVDLKARLEDAKVRYKDKPLSVWSNEEKANHLIDCALGIEKQIMEYCNISPKDINDESIEKYIIKLREYDI